MKVSADTFIAGTKTKSDWHATMPNLVNGNANVWRAAFNDYFVRRLNLRYLTPIKTLQDYDKKQGEGFSILTIQCSLIEFLESTAKGMSYRHGRGGPLNQYEYSSSQDIFVAFLSRRFPFSSTFDEATALDFYINVRCALLHEARTKGGWKIRADVPNGALADVKNKIIDRNNFQQALLKYIDNYGEAIQLDKALQEAFIRKFDSLCD